MNYKSLVDYSLYLVTERSFLKHLTLKEALRQALQGGVTLVQLREKEMDTRQFYDLAVEIKKCTDSFQVPLIINDRADLVLAVGAAGLHVGQSDLPVKIARQILGKDKIIGASVTSVTEAVEAEAAGADYLGAGAIFPTGTKKEAVAIGVSQLRKIKQAVKIPVIAIGGINLQSLALLKGTNIDGIAVMSALLKSKEIEKTAREFKENIQRGIFFNEV